MKANETNRTSRKSQLPVRPAATRALRWLAAFFALFFAFWLFFTLSGSGVRWGFDGHTLNASPAVQGALTAMVFPLLILALFALFFVIFSFTWLSMGLIVVATLFIVGMSFLPLMAPILLPLAFFMLLLALFSRQEKAG